MNLKFSNSKLRSISTTCAFLAASLPSLASQASNHSMSTNEVQASALEQLTVPQPEESRISTSNDLKTNQNRTIDKTQSNLVNERLPNQKTVNAHRLIYTSIANLKTWWSELVSFFQTQKGQITGAGVLATLGVLAAFRGLIKGSWEASLIVKGLRSFSARDFTKVTNLNVYFFQEADDGTVKLRPITKEHLRTVNLFPSLGYQKHFMKAAKKCTESQGIVTLNFPKDSESYEAKLKKFFKPVFFVAFVLAYGISFGRWRFCENMLQAPDDRFTALNRVNKALREVVSPLYNKGKADYAQFATRLGLEVVVEQVVIIPFCSVNDTEQQYPNDQEGKDFSRKSKSLILISLTKSDFERFRNLENLDQLQIEGEHLHSNRKLQLHKAYHAAQEYELSYKGVYAKNQELFPTVDVLFLKQKNSNQLLMPLYELETKDNSKLDTIIRDLIEDNRKLLEKNQQLNDNVQKLLDMHAE